MDWASLYTADKQPSPADMAKYIASPLWEDLNVFLQERYEVSPVYSYSACSGQPGWNVKYQKAGRALCTLYPMPGFYVALVVIGSKEDAEASLVIPTCDETVQALYNHTPAIMGGRWLMIPVVSDKVLSDVKRLIQLRRKIKRRT